MHQALLFEPGTHLTASGALATLSGVTEYNAHVDANAWVALQQIQLLTLVFALLLMKFCC